MHTLGYSHATCQVNLPQYRKLRPDHFSYTSFLWLVVPFNCIVCVHYLSCATIYVCNYYWSLGTLFRKTLSIYMLLSPSVCTVFIGHAICTYSYPITTYTFHPALRNMSAWLQGLSGLVITSPGPIMLKELSTWIGLGSRKETMCMLYLSPKWRLTHSIPK